ncbi:MAG: hypothetical protein WCG23_07340 [bacterium]
MKSHIIKLLCSLIPIKNWRKYLRTKFINIDQNTEKMKLGVSYSVWDGEELLESSLLNIRPLADYINVVWQELSWFGNPCDPKLQQTLIELKNKGLIDEILFFTPVLNTSISPNDNEVKKRNIGLEAAKKAGCNYFMLLDTDEFYDKEEFEKAKKIIIDQNISHSACNQVFYSHLPIYRNINYETWFAPFIYKIDKNSKLILNGGGYYPILLDPSKIIPINKKSKFRFLGEVTMQHFGLSRKNIIQKFKNSSANNENNKDLVDFCLNNAINNQSLSEEELLSKNFVKVQNKFNIPDFYNIEKGVL